MAAAVGVAASIITLIEVAGKVWSVCWQYYADVKNASSEMKRLMDNITSIQQVFQRIQSLVNGPDATKWITSKLLIDSISELKKEFTQILQALDAQQVTAKKQHSLYFWRSKRLKWPLQKDRIGKTLRLIERYKTDLIAAINCDQMIAIVEISKNVEAMGAQIDAVMTTSQVEESSEKVCANLSKLPFAKGAAHYHRLWDHEEGCLPGTRVALRQQIMEWSDNPDSKCIFWLNGMAGTGKSTVSRTVAFELAEKKRLAASFFFSRGRGDISHAGQFFTTIAAQLAICLPVLRTSISNAIDTNSDIFQQGLREQWKKLIFNPLKNAPAQSIQLVVVIDALDECDSMQDIQLILQLLEQAKDLDTIRIRIFLTSRPEIHIFDGFHQLSGEAYQDFVLQNIPPNTVNADISTFFYQKLSTLKVKHRLALATPWPDEQTIERLVTKAAGLFIFAATTFRFIQDGLGGPEEQISLVLRDTTSSESSKPSLSATQHLDEIYTTLLQHSVVEKEPRCQGKERAEIFRQVVGSIVTMFDVMSAPNLAKLLQIPLGRVSVVLNSLHSVLRIPLDKREPVRLFHLSFRDFLREPERCIDTQFQIDVKERHIILFRNCMEHISRLRKNICELWGPGVVITEISGNIDAIQKNFPLSVQYACRYWLDHFQEGNHVQDDFQKIREFLERHFLHWLEGLSLMGEVSNGILMIVALDKMLSGKLDGYDLNLLELAHDAKRFILHNRSVIEMAPLQVYYSGLLFAPETCLARVNYLDRIPWINQEPKVVDRWSSSIQILEGHTNCVRSSQISPDGKLIASASHDKTIRLWDTSTGKQCRVLKGHTDMVISAVFAPDGKLIASTSYDQTIILWDTSTGKQCRVLKGHTSFVYSAVFAPNRKLIASASHDKTIGLWDTSTGKQCRVLKGHTDIVISAVFAPDGKLVASASHDKTIRLWDTSTGKQCRVLKGHTDMVISAVFAPDGKLIASTSYDQTIILWDTSTGKQCRVLKGHTDVVYSAVFAPDGKLIASASSDKTIRLWDTSTGKQCRVLKGHTSFVTSAVFAPNGKLIASASHDKTVRLWNTSTGKQCRVLKGHTDIVISAVFAPDGKLVASASDDKTVRLWDTSIGRCRVSESHTASVTSVVSSPNGELVAFRLRDNTIRVWDTSKEKIKQCAVLKSHNNYYESLTVVPNERLVAFSSSGATIEFWDISTENPEQCAIFEPNIDSEEVTWFSPDGKRVASEYPCDDTTIRLWDTSTGKHCEVFGGLAVGGSICRAVFSPDGTLVASFTREREMGLLDTIGKQFITLSSDTDPGSTIVFSPNGTLFACINDGTVELWDTSTRKQCGVLYGHDGDSSSVFDGDFSAVFSHDGKLFAFAADNTVILWDITKEKALQTIKTLKTVLTMKFSNDGTLLHTDRGVLELTSYVHSDDGSSHQLEPATPFLYIADQWITYNNKNLLWLPVGYRERASVVNDNVLVIGFRSDVSASLISFDFTALPPAYLQSSSDPSRAVVRDAVTRMGIGIKIEDDRWSRS